VRYDIKEEATLRYCVISNFATAPLFLPADGMIAAIFGTFRLQLRKYVT